MDEKEHSIRFINSGYDTLFCIPDGGTVEIRFPDRTFTAKCEYLDDYHTKIGKRLTSQIVEKLLKDGRARLKDCKSQKTGKTYNADILLSTEADGRPQFSMVFENRKGGGSDGGKSFR